jgi:hypothetical protein
VTGCRGISCTSDRIISPSPCNRADRDKATGSNKTTGATLAPIPTRRASFDVAQLAPGCPETAELSDIIATPPDPRSHGPPWECRLRRSASSSRAKSHSPWDAATISSVKAFCRTSLPVLINLRHFGVWPPLEARFSRFVAFVSFCSEDFLHRAGPVLRFRQRAVGHGDDLEADMRARQAAAERCWVAATPVTALVPAERDYRFARPGDSA